MQITDAHIHIWTAGKPPAQQRQEPFTAELLLQEMASAGVDAAVIIPPNWDPNGNLPANQLANSRPNKFRVMGRLELDQPAALEAIANISQRPNMLGFRVMFTAPERRALLEDGKADWLWNAAQNAKLPLMLNVPNDLLKLRDIAQRFPGLRLTIDHLGVPGHRPGTDAAMTHIPDLIALAKSSNIAIKASAVAGYSAQPYPYKNLHEPLHRLFDAFGPERMFWGTDLTKMPCTYGQCVSLFTEELPWLSQKDQVQVMGAGVRKWIGWD